jgi:hypothetical protein
MDGSSAAWIGKELTKKFARLIFSAKKHEPIVAFEAARQTGRHRW